MLVTSYRWPLFVYPSRCCNFRCSYCFTDSSSQHPLDTFLVRYWERLMDEAAEAGVPEVRLSGGEPLILPAIRAMCVAARDRGLRYTLTTNGSQLERHLPWLRDVAPQTLWISYHREYLAHEDFLRIVAMAARELPLVGVNVFARDWVPSFADCGAGRLKLLTQSPVGRATVVDDVDVSFADGLPSHVEVRMESSTREHGPSTCVLRNRPLMSVDEDGRVYACCVTVGSADAIVGDFACEPLRQILDRGLQRFNILPCASLLPEVSVGREGCPVALYAAP